MIKSVIRLVMLVVMLSGWSLAGLSLHVIRTPDKFIVIPKEHLGIGDTYVDARKWTMADLMNHPDLIRRVLETDKAGQFQYLTGKDAEGQLRGALNTPGKPALQTSISGGPLQLPVDF